MALMRAWYKGEIVKRLQISVVRYSFTSSDMLTTEKQEKNIPVLIFKSSNSERLGERTGSVIES